jgi:hypothetical protein
VQLNSPDVEVDVLTVGGHFRFLSCQGGMRVAIGPAGDLQIIDMRLTGGGGCTDINRCPPPDNPDAGPPPWRGRIVSTPGGRLQARIAACFDTCIGFFAGPLTVEVSPDGRRWKSSERVGTGFDIAGWWRASSVSSSVTGVRLQSRAG